MTTSTGNHYDITAPSEDGIVMSRRQNVEAEPAQYDIVIGADGMKIGRAFALDSGDIVIECAALPVSGQMRLRKVTP